MRNTLLITGVVEWQLRNRLFSVKYNLHGLSYNLFILLVYDVVVVPVVMHCLILDTLRYDKSRNYLRLLPSLVAEEGFEPSTFGL